MFFVFIFGEVSTPFAAISSHFSGILFSVSVSLYFMLDTLADIFDNGGWINARQLKLVMEECYLFLNPSVTFLFYRFVFKSRRTYL